jgi:hypothetical protein
VGVHISSNCNFIINLAGSERQKYERVVTQPKKKKEGKNYIITLIKDILTAKAKYQ